MNEDTERESLAHNEEMAPDATPSSFATKVVRGQSQELDFTSEMFVTPETSVEVGFDRALVLHGGGSAGNAWEIGVIAGLLEAGLDATEADLTIGTSAGATAAGQIAGASPSDLFAAILDEVSREREIHSHSDRRRTPIGPVADHMDRTGRLIAEASSASDMRRRMGAAALALDADGDGTDQAKWRAIAESRLPRQDWPSKLMFLTAVNARTGVPVVFDRYSGVPLADAIASSTANGFGVPPFSIGHDRFIDGGYRRNENADLAAGFRKVLVLSPFGGISCVIRGSGAWTLPLRR